MLSCVSASERDASLTGKATYGQPVTMCNVFICSLHFINGLKEWMVLSNFKYSCETKVKSIKAIVKY